MRTPSSLPVIVIGAGPVGLFAAAQLGDRGFKPVLIEAMPTTGGACAAEDPASGGALSGDLAADLSRHDPLFLFNRRAASIWGSLEAGFSVETDTGETVTGAAVVYTGGHGALSPTGPASPPPASDRARRLRASGCDLTPGWPTGLPPVADVLTGETALSGVFAPAQPPKAGPDALPRAFAEARRTAVAVAARLTPDLHPTAAALRRAAVY